MPDIDPDAWYIYDHVDQTVVAQDLSEEAADDRVRERGARCMAVSGAALQEFDAETTISWETDDVRKVTDGGQTQKTIEGWLVIDWRNETHRTRKSKPSASELGANELLAELRVTVTVPEVEVPTLALNVDVPKRRVEATELDALDEDEMPGWVEALHERLPDADVVEDLSPSDRERLLHEVTLNTLEAVPTRPDPGAVREYARECIERLAAGENLNTGGDE